MILERWNTEMVKTSSHLIFHGSGLNGANNDETTTIDVVIATMEQIGLPLTTMLAYEKDKAKLVKKKHKLSPLNNNQ